MELKLLVISQFVLDLIILGILLMLGRYYLNRKAATADFKSAMDKAMSLINEMEALGTSLNKILEEKRELSNRLIADLDMRLKKAEIIRDEIKKITATPMGRKIHTNQSKKTGNATKRLIEELLMKGLSKEEIAKHLDLPSGELELIMKLNGQDTEKK